MAIKIRHVDGDEEHDILMDLQKICLPGDHPIEPDGITQWWIAYDGGDAIAFASLSPSKQIAARGYLSRAGVLSSHRGHGIQKKLIRARIAYAKKIGYTSLVTDTIPANPASINSLIACGFYSFIPEVQWYGQWVCYWKHSL